MKKVLLFLMAAGLASASAVSLNTLYKLADSDLISKPTGTVHGVGGFGSVGGLCTFESNQALSAATTCPNDGTPVAAGDTLTFTLPSTSFLTIILQDSFTVGDVYEVIVTDTTTAATFNYQSTAVALNGPTNTSLNVNTGVFNSGDHFSIQVWDILLSYIGLSDPFGGGTVPVTNPPGEGHLGTYSPAAFNLTINATPVTVPEPASLALLGLGGIGLGLIRRRIAK